MDAITFQTEVKQIEKLLFRIAWSYLGNNQDVEDAVQEALFKAWEKRETLRKQTQFTAWLAQILVNQCKNILRKRKKWSMYPLEEETIWSTPSSEEAPILEALRKLKPEQRIAMTLFYVDNYSLSDIAEILGCPVGTIKTRLYAARKQIKQILLVEWEEEL